MNTVAKARSRAHAIAQTSVANVVVQVANIISGVLTARALGPDGRGILAAVIMWPQFLAFSMTMGVPTASVYWIKKRPELARQLAGAGIVLSICFGLLATLVGVAVIPFSLHAYQASYVHLAQLWTTVTVLALLSVTLMSQTQAAEQFGLFNIFRVISPLSVVSVLLIARVLGHLSIQVAAFAYLFAATPVTIWFGARTLQHYRPLFETSSAYRLLLTYGLRAWGADLLGTVVNQIDRILVVGLLAPDVLGLYVVAQSAAGVLGVLPAAITPVTLPQSAAASAPDVLLLAGKAARATLYVMICASLPLIVLGKWLLTLVYGGSFSAAYAALPFLVAEGIADGLVSVLSQSFLASGFPGTITLLQGAGLASAIPLLYLLIPRLGLRGAACALMLSTFCRLLLVLVSFPWRLSARPPRLLMTWNELKEFVTRLGALIHFW